MIDNKTEAREYLTKINDEMKSMLKKEYPDIQPIKNQNVNPYKYPLMKDVFDPLDKMELISFLLSTDRYAYSDKIKEFEKNWSEWLGTQYSVFVNSGSSANLILIAAIKEKYNIPDGSKVLVPACTWSTNICPLIQLGLKPIFCDICFDNFSFDQGHLTKIQKTDSDITLIFVTHLLGLVSNIKILKELFPKAIILEDCCESHGAVYDGKKVGTQSEASTFSFFFGHHMTTIEGGMVSTNDLELYKLLCLKRSHGLARELPVEDFKKLAKENPNINEKFLFVTDGYNVRSTELNAVLGIRQLKKLDGFVSSRRENFSKYIQILKKFQNHFYIPKEEGNSSFCLPFVTKEKAVGDALKIELEKASIESRPIVGANLIRQPFLKKYEVDITNFPNADILHFNGVYIANNQFLDESFFLALDGAISASLIQRI